jgi:hypothetical protein
MLSNPFPYLFKKKKYIMNLQLWANFEYENPMTLFMALKFLILKILTLYALVFT